MENLAQVVFRLAEKDAKRQYYEIANELWPGPPKGLFFNVDDAITELVVRHTDLQLSEWKSLQSYQERLPFLRYAATEEIQGKSDNIPNEETSGQADTRTDNENNSEIKLPENGDVLKLDQIIKRIENKDRILIEIAREFTKSDEKKAQSLLRERRRYRKGLDELRPPQK